MRVNVCVYAYACVFDCLRACVNACIYNTGVFGEIHECIALTHIRLITYIILIHAHARTHKHTHSQITYMHIHPIHTHAHRHVCVYMKSYVSRK